MHGKNVIIGCGYGWRKENQVEERKIPLRVFCNNMNNPRQRGERYIKMKHSKHYLYLKYFFLKTQPFSWVLGVATLLMKTR